MVVKEHNMLYITIHGKYYHAYKSNFDLGQKYSLPSLELGWT